MLEEAVAITVSRGYIGLSGHQSQRVRRNVLGPESDYPVEMHRRQDSSTMCAVALKLHVAMRGGPCSQQPSDVTGQQP